MSARAWLLERVALRARRVEHRLDARVCLPPAHTWVSSAAAPKVRGMDVADATVEALHRTSELPADIAVVLVERLPSSRDFPWAGRFVPGVR